MGKSRRTKVGNHYRLALHIGLLRGPIDAFLEKRAADKTAWEGRLEASGRINIRAPELFGGEKDQGGIDGPADVMFGEEDQLPNPYLQSTFGNQTVAWRGLATYAFCGGRYGAMNPFPQKPSFLLEKILNGWDGDGCWYPEKARVPISGNFEAGLLIGNSGLFSGGEVGISVSTATLANQSEPLPRYFRVSIGPSAQNCPRRFIVRQTSSNAFVYDSGWIGDATTQAEMNAILVSESLAHLIEPIRDGNGLGELVETDFEPGYVTVTTYTVRLDDGSGSGQVNADIHFYAADVDTRRWSMNAAHTLYYVRTDGEKGREPRDNIDDANLRAAADVLHNEGFGLCWVFNPENDTVESFEERICQIIDGGFDRSLRDGKWRLRLLRNDYTFETLPILSDSDGAGGGLILSFRELPSTLDGAVNVVGVRYFDIERKERLTVWARAPGLVQQFGENKQLFDFPEIPSGGLAARVAERKLRTFITPKRSFEISTDPSYRHIDRYETVRFQSPKRGITDMVCIVGEKNHGTLRSGAIRWVLTQHVYGFADTAVVEVEYGEDTRPPTQPVPAGTAIALEAPYTEVCARLTNAELDALPEGAGFLFGMAAQPSHGIDFALAVRPTGGQHEVVGYGDWAPTALVVEASGYEGQAFTLSEGVRLANVAVGDAAIWGSEIVRVDALNLTTGAVQFGRACADTVPVQHAAGERIWFLGGHVAADVTEYTDGETIDVRVLPGTGSRRLSVWDAASLSVTFDGRLSRPYPPARLRVAGSANPSAASGAFTVEWRHRDRQLQADQLVDLTAASIGPEQTTRYALRILDASNAVLVQKLDIAGTTATVDLAYTGDVTLELYAVNDYGDSLQRHVRAFAYTSGSATENTITADTYEPPYTIIDGGEVT